MKINKRAVVVALGVLSAGIGVWQVYRGVKKPRRPAAEIVAAKEGPIESTVDATGSVAPRNRVEIKPPISGRIEKLIAEEGAKVQAGQVLAWMSSSDRAAILDAARARGPEELAKWQDAYKPTPIVAPLSGVVILRNVVVGQTVDPSTILYAMSDTLVVVAQVDESDVGRVRVGMPARVTLDSYPDRSVEGAVFEILSEGKNVSNVIQYGVKVKIEPVPPYFRSQMTANVSFIVQRRPKAVLIPASAVRELSGGGKQVLVPGGEGRPPVAREIKTGVESGESVEVLEGLEAGDKVVIARSRYVPQQGPQTSPLTMGGRPSGTSGQAPRSRKSGQ
jgi:membrane fusion protein, macrolide-specific efflux system